MHHHTPGLRPVAKPKTSWPIAIYMAVCIVALIATNLLSLALDGVETNRARTIVQFLLFLIPLARLLIAMHRSERSRIWIAYIAGMALTPPAWLFLVEPLWDRLEKP